jgi:hypothetical protein
MKLSKLVDPQYHTTLKKLASQEIPLRTAFKLRGIIKLGADELAKYEEVRGDALKRFGTKNEDGTLVADDKGTVSLSEDNMKLFVAELNLLLLTDVSVGTIKIAELGENVSLTTHDLMILDDLIVD